MKDDIIYRQDAIDALADYIRNVDKVIGTGYLSADDCKDAATSVLENVPSVQPEVDCFKCIFRGSPGFKQFQTKTEERTAELVQNVSDSDLISRKAAIDAVTNGMCSGYDCEVIEALEYLPSAQPEHRTGKWIPQDHNKRAGNISTCVYCYPICSKCGKVGIETYKFCPMCGAKMEGADDE